MSKDVLYISEINNAVVDDIYDFSEAEKEFADSDFIFLLRVLSAEKRPYRVTIERLTDSEQRALIRFSFRTTRFHSYTIFRVSDIKALDLTELDNFQVNGSQVKQSIGDYIGADACRLVKYIQNSFSQYVVFWHD